MEYHQDRFDDYSLMIYKENQLIGLLPSNLNAGVLHSHQGLTYGGLVLSETIKFGDVFQAFKSILQFLESHSINQLNIKPIPSIYCKLPSDEIDYLLFLVDGKCIRKDVLSVIDLKHQIRRSNDRRNGYKRGVKHELEVREVDDFSEFWNEILIPNLKDKHNVLPVHSLEEITRLKQKFQKNIRQFNVYKKDDIVAGTTIFETPIVAHSQYISGNKDKNMFGSLDFLHIHVLEKVFDKKQYFDFGISNENNGLQINEGLQYWKEGFGARTITQDFYQIETKNHRLLDNVFL